MLKREYGCQSGKPKKFFSPLDFSHRDYWVGLGHQVEKTAEGWLVKLNKSSTTILDQGDRLTVHTVQEPTDDEILALIRCGHQRGWKSIYFWGSESFQHRARALAVKHNFYAWDDVSLECEAGRTSLMAAEMPKHIRDKLAPPVEPEPSPPMPATTDIPEPIQELRP